MMNWTDLLFLGDSLTAGAREPMGMSWPYYMAHAALQEGVVIRPEVEAENGRRSSDLVRVASSRIASSTAKEAFVLIGTNDAKDSGTLPTAMTLRNIQLIVAWCQIAEIRPYVMTVPLPNGFGSPGYTSSAVDRIRALNVAIREAGFANLIECEDLAETTDGIHLDTSSAIELGNRAWAAVKRTRTFSGSLARIDEALLQ